MGRLLLVPNQLSAVRVLTGHDTSTGMVCQTLWPEMGTSIVSQEIGATLETIQALGSNRDRIYVKSGGRAALFHVDLTRQTVKGREVHQEAFAPGPGRFHQGRAGVRGAFCRAAHLHIYNGASVVSTRSRHWRTPQI